MKIEKGYTLSQFVDYIESNTICEYSGIDVTNVINYNNLLKQPIKKEMFVNEFTHPDNMAVKWSTKKGNPFYQRHLNQWQEAEKKVIFGGWLLNSDERFCFLGLTHMAFYSDGEMTYYENEDDMGTNIKTLADLLQSANGELITKNLEI